MYIKAITLQNYRNYDNFNLTLTPGINLVIGKNAVGKTNLLEAIYFLENGRSHRTRTLGELIKWEREFLHVKAAVERLDRAIVIEASVDRVGGRQLKVNGVKQQGFSGRTRAIHTVMFTPDHLKIVKEMPEHRRAYIDEILEKIKGDYSYWRQQYAKVLRQRNLLLKKVASGRMKQDMIDYWDIQLVEAGVKIITHRRDTVDLIEKHAVDAYARISGVSEEFSLRYENQLLAEGASTDGLRERFLDSLKKKRSSEIARGLTLVGPHRDDIGTYIAGIDIRTYGSQGEQRSVALALKIAELEVMTAILKEHPVLLLDDVMSELDAKRRDALMEYIKNGSQILITSTNIDYFKDMEIDGFNMVSM